MSQIPSEKQLISLFSRLETARNSKGEISKKNIISLSMVEVTVAKKSTNSSKTRSSNTSRKRKIQEVDAKATDQQVFHFAVNRCKVMSSLEADEEELDIINDDDWNVIDEDDHITMCINEAREDIFVD